MSKIPDQVRFEDEPPDHPLMGTWRMNPNGCGCRLCNPHAGWFVTCATCGNKRCPKATNHNLDCTNSNESGQKGSEWENIK